MTASVLVIGLGPMGRGIARLFAAQGASTTVLDATPELTRAGHARLLEEAEADRARDRALPGAEDIAVAASLDAAASADVVLEAIIEEIGAKRELLAALAERAKPDAIVCSNTSSLSVAEMGRAFGSPERLVGMHFFNPPTRMRLVEVIAGPATSAETLERAVAWARALGKEPVVCADSPNFIVNRVCRPLYYEAQLLVTQGVEAAVVDAVARGALGHRMGPLELLDFTGLHTHLGSSETALREFGDPRYRPIPIARGLVRAGLTGRAAGRGFYDHVAEPPRAAQQRVVRMPASASNGVSATIVEDMGDRPHAEAVAEAHRALEEGHNVVVDSSRGAWLQDLPPGAGWLRLHRRPDGPFAELVNDPIAGIEPPAFVPALLDSLRAQSVEVPALPGLVADRLESTLVNEAVGLVEEGTAQRDAVDTALRLGMNHPAGPFERMSATGAEIVLTRLLDLQEHSGDPRYRPALLLRRLAAGERRRAARLVEA